MALLFAYGTLKRGLRNHRYLHGQEFIGIGHLKGYEILCLDPYPVIVVTGNPEDCVEGEVYRVSPPDLPQIDRLEGHEYDRVSVNLCVDGELIAALTYVASGQLIGDLRNGRRHRLINGSVWSR